MVKITSSVHLLPKKRCNCSFFSLSLSLSVICIIDPSLLPGAFALDFTSFARRVKLHLYSVVLPSRPVHLFLSRYLCLSVWERTCDSLTEWKMAIWKSNGGENKILVNLAQKRPVGGKRHASCLVEKIGNSGHFGLLGLCKLSLDQWDTRTRRKRGRDREEETKAKTEKWIRTLGAKKLRTQKERKKTLGTLGAKANRVWWSLHPPSVILIMSSFSFALFSTFSFSLFTQCPYSWGRKWLIDFTRVTLPLRSVNFILNTLFLCFSFVSH